MVPKIRFRYSWIYDLLFREAYNDKEYPSNIKILNYIERIKPLWVKEEKKVLEELARITGLKWKEKEVVCYVVGKCISFSDPLTLRVQQSKTRFIDVLVHEMIHQLFIQNQEELRDYWKYLFKKYEKESKTTVIHIPLQAIHKKIFLNLFSQRRFKKDVEMSAKKKDYKRAVDIVEKEGHERIIEDMKKKIR